MPSLGRSVSIFEELQIDARLLADATYMRRLGLRQSEVALCSAVLTYNTDCDILRVALAGSR